MVPDEPKQQKNAKCKHYSDANAHNDVQISLCLNDTELEWKLLSWKLESWC